MKGLGGTIEGFFFSFRLGTHGTCFIISSHESTACLKITWKASPFVFISWSIRCCTVLWTMLSPKCQDYCLEWDHCGLMNFFSSFCSFSWLGTCRSCFAFRSHETDTQSVNLTSPHLACLYFMTPQMLSGLVDCESCQGPTIFHSSFRHTTYWRLLWF